MADVEVIKDPRHDLTVFTAHGELTADEIIQQINNFYAGKPTELVLWDGTDGSQRNLQLNEVKKVFAAMKQFSEMRKSGRTAFVAGRDVDYGIGRMYEAYGECDHVPVSYRVFKSRDEALQWLGVKKLEAERI